MKDNKTITELGRVINKMDFGSINILKKNILEDKEFLELLNNSPMKKEIEETKSKILEMNQIIVKSMVENILNLFEETFSQINTNVFKDISKQFSLYTKNFELSPEKIEKCANFGIGYIVGIQPNLFIRNYDSLEEANIYLNNISSEQLHEIFDLILDELNSFEDNNEYLNSLINESIFNFDYENYTSCVICLSTIFEMLLFKYCLYISEKEENNITASKKNNPLEKENINSARSIYRKLEILLIYMGNPSFKDNTHLDIHTINRSLSIGIILKNMFTGINETEESGDNTDNYFIPNRHQIAHGKRKVPYEKYDCIKLYIILYEILEILNEE